MKAQWLRCFLAFVPIRSLLGLVAAEW